MIDLMIRENLFYPDDFKKTVYDIDYVTLKEKGIKAILIDLDNTLIPYDETLPNQRIHELFEHIDQLGFEIIIISNNHLNRVESFAKKLDARFICSAKKPLKRGFQRAMALLDIQNPKEICVIGDQFMTDVFGGKRMGFYVIVVNAIKRNVEKWYTKMNRQLEKRMIKRIKRHKPEMYIRLGLNEKR
ncbi:MAG: YqeG family HAD IIIA-type phosphatase [Firmicutes bacterium]|nr:YqeG family HAD IIIA-type phosphatase [Bacillota bacterium]